MNKTPWIHLFDFVIALVIFVCGIYALYLMFTSPYEGGSFRTAIRPIALGCLAVLFGVYHFRYALRQYREKK